MKSEPGHALTGVRLDPVEARALATAIERLPARAAGDCRQPLTPSLRAVLDRFLSTPLRVPLRSLGSAGGPVAVTIDGLPVGPGPRSPQQGLNPTEAVATWLTEAAGLFPAPDRPDGDPARPQRLRSATGWSDHVLVLAMAEPGADDTTIRCAPLDIALAELEPAMTGILGQDRYRPANADPNGPDDPNQPGGPAPARSILAPIGSTVALTLDPRSVRGIDQSAEAVRHGLIDALGRAADDVVIRPGTGVLADRRRCLLDPDLDRPWLRRVDLVVDPLATFVHPSDPDRSTGSGRLGGDRR